MDTTLTIKTKKDILQKAKDLADDLGITMTNVLNVMLKQFIRDRSLYITNEPKPRPEKLLEWERISKEMDEGNFVGPFKDAKSMMKYLRSKQ